MRLIAVPGPIGSLVFTISRQGVGGRRGVPEWTVHARGSIATDPADADVAGLELARSEAATSGAAEHYNDMVSCGLEYGPAFRGVRAMLKAGNTVDADVALPDTVRITLELDREVSYHEERIGGPARLFFDLKNVQASPDLKDKVLSFSSDAVSKIRVGRHPDSTVRVVLDFEEVSKYSVFTLYNPFRLVIDAERKSTTVAATKNAPTAKTGPATTTIAAAAPPPPPTTPAPSPALAPPPTTAKSYGSIWDCSARTW